MQIFCIILVLGLTTGTGSYVFLIVLEDLLEAEICVVAVHLTDDLDIGWIIIEKI